MLSNEERIAEVKYRIAYKNQYREHCRNRALTAVSFVAALMLVIGFFFFMEHMEIRDGIVSIRSTILLQAYFREVQPSVIFLLALCLLFSGQG